MNPDLRLALELADAADAITVSRFRSADLVVHTKPDATPVSAADQAVEEELRRLLTLRHPGDGILGEEYGEAPAGERRWIIDPIDGTANYVRGIPVWATLIALEEAGEITAGVASAPLLGRRWWATRGAGAWGNAEPIHVSAVGRLADAQLSYPAQVTFEECGYGRQGEALSRLCRRTRGFGDFWMYMLVAEGAVDLAVDPIASLWDLAAPKVIVEEAGGRFTDFGGAPRADGGNGVASNGLVHDEALAVLADPHPAVPPRRGPVVP
ncbi:MAG TPA: inositol monophosphatase family protein [Acidimicrobiia bacterium]|nr:inositol monophosphatase family protein [Acidimicrobiia bacterium]